MCVHVHVHWRLLLLLLLLLLLRLLLQPYFYSVFLVGFTPLAKTVKTVKKKTTAKKIKIVAYRRNKITLKQRR